jgi:peptide/nickel transport system substrate-binding protein
MRTPDRLVALAALLALGACRDRPPHAGRYSASLVPHDGGTLRVHVEAEPPTLNPLVEHDAWTVWIALGAVYDPLVREDARGRFSPSLATRWIAKDARTLELTLRPGVTWHDGRPFSADDVVATFALLAAPGVSGDLRADFADVASVEKLGPLAIALHLSRPVPLLLQSLSRLAILPAHRFSATAGDLRAQPASRAPVGTGPFRLVEWRAGERMALERAPAYWGPQPHLERVELRIVRDRDAAFELFRRGELDLLWQLTPPQLERAAALAPAREVDWLLPRYGFVVWNTARPGLADRRVRQALTLLTDRDRYLRVAYRGHARAVSGPYPLDSPSYDAAVEPWPYDPKRARALLDEAGVRDRDGDGVREVDGRPFRITFLLHAGSKVLEPLVTMMQEDFRRAGVLLEAAPVDWATLLDRLRHHAFDAASLQWVMLPVQDNYPLFHSSQADGGQNYGAFHSDEVDAVLGRLRALAPGAERAALDRQLHRLIHVEQPYTFLGCPEVESLLAARVHGYAPDAAGLGLPSLWVDE